MAESLSKSCRTETLGGLASSSPDAITSPGRAEESREMWDALKKAASQEERIEEGSWSRRSNTNNR